jgi:site-specific DNA recombinase
VSRGKKYPYYRCTDELTSRNFRAPRGHAPNIPARWLEETVWADVRPFLENPGEVLARVREQMESDNETAELEERHADLATRLAAKHKERDRWLHLYTQSHISEEELKLHLADVGTQLDNLKLLLSSVESDLAAKHEEVELAESAEAWLLTLRERLSEVEEDSEEAFERRRQLVKLLVAGITAGKDEEGRPDVRITYRFGPPELAHGEAMFVHGVNSSTRK